MRNELINDDVNRQITSGSRYSDACETYSQIKNLENNNLSIPLIPNLNSNSNRKHQKHLSDLSHKLDDNIIKEEKEEEISDIYSMKNKNCENICVLSTAEENNSNIMESDSYSKNNSTNIINSSIKKKSKNDNQKKLKITKKYEDKYNDVKSFASGTNSYNVLLNDQFNKNSEIFNINKNKNNINLINENETNNSNININNELRNRESISTNHISKRTDINTNIKNNIKKTSSNSITTNDENNTSNITNLDDFIEKENNIIETEENLSINKVKFIDIKQDEIDTTFLKTKLRKIQVNSKNIKNPKNKYIRCLIELQNFYIDNSSIWVIKLNHDGNYLAAGCQSGIIKIYKIINYKYDNFKNSYDKDNILNYCNFICQKPFKTLQGHKSDIIDLSWSPFFPNLLLSASLDYYIILWDVSLPENNCQINKYEHSDMVTCVDFNPVYKNIFISGCLDTFVRQWFLDYDKNSGDKINEKKKNIIIEENNQGFIIGNKKNINNDNNKFSFYSLIKSSKNKKNPTIDKNIIDYFNVAQKITSVSYFPDGLQIAIGTERGKIYIYKTFPKITYVRNFDCKNKLGRFRRGKKITNIEFFDKDSAIITTADSRLRYVTMPEGKLIHKYKGYVNKNKMVRTHSDLCNDVIISGSEDGNCYIWNLFNLEDNSKKNYHYEYFKPFSKDTIECSIIAPEKCYTNYMQKIFKLTNKLLIVSIIINATSGGRLEVLLNIDDHYRK